MASTINLREIMKGMNYKLEDGLIEIVQSEEKKNILKRTSR